VRKQRHFGSSTIASRPGFPDTRGADGMRPPLQFTRSSIVPEILYTQNDFPDMLFDTKMFSEVAGSVFIFFVFCCRKSEIQAIVDTGIILSSNPHFRTL
jgi:hypothetical protein